MEDDDDYSATAAAARRRIRLSQSDGWSYPADPSVLSSENGSLTRRRFQRSDSNKHGSDGINGSTVPMLLNLQSPDESRRSLTTDLFLPAPKLRVTKDACIRLLKGVPAGGTGPIVVRAPTADEQLFQRLAAGGGVLAVKEPPPTASMAPANPPRTSGGSGIETGSTAPPAHGFCRGATRFTTGSNRRQVSAHPGLPQRGPVPLRGPTEQSRLLTARFVTAPLNRSHILPCDQDNDCLEPVPWYRRIFSSARLSIPYEASYKQLAIARAARKHRGWSDRDSFGGRLGGGGGGATYVPSSSPVCGDGEGFEATRPLTGMKAAPATTLGSEESPQVGIRRNKRRNRKFVVSELYNDTHPYQRSDTFLFDNLSVFAVTMTGSIVGATNLSRFPYLVYYYNGLPFIMAYFISSALVARPIMLLEVTLAQTLRSSQTAVLESFGTRWRGVGLAMVTCATFGLIFNARTVVYLLYYLTRSFTNEFPWRISAAAVDKCTSTPTQYCALGGPFCGYNDGTGLCGINQLHYAIDYFQSMRPVGGVRPTAFYHVATSGLWFVMLPFVFRQGYRLLYGLAIWTLSTSAVILTFLFFFGVTLNDATYGLREFLGGEGWHDFWDPYMWSFAIGQAIASSTICTVCLSGLGRANKPDGAINAATLIALIVDGTIGLLASLGMYPYLQFFSWRTSSVGLQTLRRFPSYMLFVMFPLSLSYLPGAAVMCVLFFGSGFLMCLVSLLSPVLALVQELSEWRLFRRVKRQYVTVIFVGLCCGLHGLSNSRSIFPVLETLDLSIQQVGYPTLALMLVLIIAWYGNYTVQVDNVGVTAILIFLAGFVLMLVGIGATPQCYRDADGELTDGRERCLVIAAIAGFFAFALVASIFAYRFRRAAAKIPCGACSAKQSACRECTHPVCMCKSRVGTYMEALWWMSLGNTEVLRAHMNEIILGPLPTAPLLDESKSSHKQRQFRYGRENWVSNRLSLLWMFCLKFIIPPVLVFTLTFQILHVRGRAPHVTGYNIRAFEDYLSEPAAQLRLQRSYQWLLLGVLLLMAVTFAMPITSTMISAGRGVCVYPTKWPGAYEPSPRERVERVWSWLSEFSKVVEQDNGQPLLCVSSVSQHYDASPPQRKAAIRTTVVG